MKNVFSVFLVLTISIVFGFDVGASSIFTKSRKGVLINPDQATYEFPLHPGDPVRFSGQICFMKIRHDEERCEELEDLESVELKAFFPDMATDVSDKVDFYLEDGVIRYSYMVDEIPDDAENTFRVMIGNGSEELDRLIKFHGNIVKRINKIIEIINRLENKQMTKVATKFREILVSLEGVRERTLNKINEDPSVLARLDAPLLVDNIDSANFYYHSIIGGLKLQMEMLGSMPIEGEDRVIETRLFDFDRRNISFPAYKSDSKDEKDNPSKLYSFELLHMFNDKTEASINLDEIPEGEEIITPINLKNLQPSVQNVFTFKVLKKRKTGNNIKTTTMAMVSKGIIVTKDTTPPVWLFGPIEATGQYFKTFPTIEAMIADDFGRIDDKKIIANVVIDSFQGTTIKKDILSSLQIDDLWQQKKYRVSGNPEITLEGNHHLVLSGQDRSGNFSIPKDLTAKFIIDHSAPKLEIVFNNQKYTNAESFPVQAIIRDDIPVVTDITHNGELILSTTDKEIGTSFNLKYGKNTFLIQSKDKAGNSSDPFHIDNIFFDNINPTIGEPNLDFNSVHETLRPELKISVGDDLSGIDVESTKVIVNGVDKSELFSITDSIISYKKEVSFEKGLNEFEFYVFDKAGNYSLKKHSVFVGISLPAFKTTPKEGDLVESKHSQMLIEYSGTDLNIDTLNIVLNGNDITHLFDLSNGHAFLSKSPALKKGENELFAEISNIYGFSESVFVTFEATFTEFLDPSDLAITLPKDSEDESKEVVKTTDFGKTVSISDPLSPGFGASAIIPGGALEKDSEVTVALASAQEIADIEFFSEESPEPDELGPVIRFTSSEQHSNEKTFKKDVIVSIPINIEEVDLSEKRASDFRIIRYDTKKKVFQTIEPFQIDKDAGLLFAKTDSFSLYWIQRFYAYDPNDYTYSYDYMDVKLSEDISCITVDSGHLCEVPKRDVTVTGLLTSNLLEDDSDFSVENDLSISCTECESISKESITTTFTETYYVWGRRRTREVTREEAEFSIDMSLPTDRSFVEVQFKLGPIKMKRKIFFSVVPEFQVPDNDIDPESCNTPGMVCPFAGKADTGFSPDGTIASDAKLNFTNQKFNLLNIRKDKTDRIYWIEPTDKYNLTTDKFIEIKLRRVGFDFKIETLGTFTLSVERLFEEGVLPELAVRFDILKDNANKAFVAIQKLSNEPQSDNYDTFKLSHPQLYQLDIVNQTSFYYDPQLNPGGSLDYVLSQHPERERSFYDEVFTVRTQKDQDGAFFVSGRTRRPFENKMNSLGDTLEDLKGVCSCDYYLDDWPKLFWDKACFEEKGVGHWWSYVDDWINKNNNLLVDDLLSHRVGNSDPSYRVGGNKFQKFPCHYEKGYHNYNYLDDRSEVNATPNGNSKSVTDMVAPSVWLFKRWLSNSNANCIVLERGGIQEVVGSCGTPPNPSPDGVHPRDAILGRPSSISIDKYQNIYFIDNLPSKRLRLSYRSKLWTILGSGNLPLSYENLPAKASKLALDNEYLRDTVWDAFTTDSEGNVYGFNGKMIYRLAKPTDLIDEISSSTKKDALVVHTPPSETTLVESELNFNTMNSLLLNSQDHNGFWDFEETYLGSNRLEDDELRRLTSTLNALDYFHSQGIKDGPHVEKALTWLANQKYSSTSMISAQLKGIAKFKNLSSKLATVQLAQKHLLLGISSRYKPPFFGWGTTEHMVVNNFDTAEALSALSRLSVEYDFSSLGISILMSDYIGPIKKLISKQFGLFSSGPGGWGFWEAENEPTMLITLSAVNMLLDYREINPLDARLIESSRREEFKELRDTAIPFVVSRAIRFFYNSQRSDGSFGNVDETVRALKLLNKIISKDIIQDPSLLSMINGMIADGVSFLNSKSDLSVLHLGSLASLTSHLEDISTSVLSDTDTKIDQPEENIDVTKFGDGSDGYLYASNIFNLSQNSSGHRTRPDGISLPVTEVLSSSVKVNNFTKGDYTVGDEVLLMATRGSGKPGTYEIKTINSITATSIYQVSIEFETPLDKVFNNQDDIILQRIPNYSNVNSPDKLVITADPWNGRSGGIVIFRSQKGISSNVSIDANGIGFRGGQGGLIDSEYKTAQGEAIVGLGNRSTSSLGENHCGGGNAEDGVVSGGGGSHQFKDEDMSGATLNSKSGLTFGEEKILKPSLGCGGGAGINSNTLHPSHGGNGGGIVILYASKLILDNNSITANGFAGSDVIEANNDVVGAGGGSGGSIILNLGEATISDGAVSAIGGKGSSGTSGKSGGNGGGGYIRINYNQLNGLNFPDSGSGEASVNVTTPSAYSDSF